MKLLIVSDSPAIQSGLGRVTRELADRFAREGVDVAVAGWFDIHGDRAMEFDYPVYPAVKMQPESVAPYLEGIDTVLAIGDPWDFEWLAAQRAQGAPFRLIGYLNVEGAPLPVACERILDGFDVLITTSEFGARVINRPVVRAVHHGVGPQFRRRPGPARLGHRELADTFVVLLNGQNTVRKNFPTALEGFELFARNKTDVVLYANTCVNPGAEDMPGPDLRLTVLTLGLDGKDSVWFNPDNHGPLRTVSDDHLAKIYNLASVLLVTSWSEGFCLPVLEAQSCGVVPVAPEDYSMPELVGDRGYLYPVAARLENNVGMRVAVVSAQDVAAALERAYSEWKFNRAAWSARQDACEGFARSRSWERTFDHLKNAIEAPIGRRVARGGPISPQLRLKARAAAHRHPGAVGVLKLGGLGDLLQTTVVLRALTTAYGRQAVVFTNQRAPVFEESKDVVEVVPIDPMPQQVALESVGDEFPAFYDLRYVSRAYGLHQTAPFGDTHRWFYDHWTGSLPRLHTLQMHSTRLMLESLGLESESLRPIYTPRQKCELPEGPFVAVANGVGVMGGLKRWPQEAWARLVEQIHAEVGLPVIQIGGEQDLLIPEAIDFRGRSLAVTAWTLEQAALMVGVEGGMVHLAAATGTRTVVIFGPTPTEAFLYPGHWAVKAPRCTPCWGFEPHWAQETCALGHSSCANFPTPEAVGEQVRSLLRGN